MIKFGKRSPILCLFRCNVSTLTVFIKIYWFEREKLLKDQAFKVECQNLCIFWLLLQIYHSTFHIWEVEHSIYSARVLLLLSKYDLMRCTMHCGYLRQIGSHARRWWLKRKCMKIVDSVSILPELKQVHYYRNGPRMKKHREWQPKHSVPVTVACFAGKVGEMIVTNRMVVAGEWQYWFGEGKETLELSPECKVEVLQLLID